MLNYLKLFRLPLVFTAVADSAAGFLYLWILKKGDAQPSGLVFNQLGMASGCLYMFGMAMNDVADRGRDRTLAPARPLPSGKISLRGALTASFAVLLLSLAGVLLRPGPWSLWPLGVWGMLVAFILLYDFLLKIPPLMGIVRALNVLLGAFTAWVFVGGDVREATYVLGIPPLVYVTALTFVSTLEEGKLKLPVLGLGALGMAAGAVSPAIVRWGLGLQVHPAGWGAAAVLAGWSVWRAATAKDRKGVMLLVRDGVAGIIVLDASILLFAGMPQGFSILLLLVPAAMFVALFKRLG